MRVSRAGSAAAGAVAGWVGAECGIVAGCGIAANVLSMVNAPHAQRLLASSEMLRLRLYVDDCRLACTGTPEDVAVCLAKATSLWAQGLSDEGGVINRRRARFCLEAALKEEGIGVKLSSIDMGVDAASVARRRVVRLWKRGHTAVQAAKRGGRLRGTTELRARMIKTWMQPAKSCVWDKGPEHGKEFASGNQEGLGEDVGGQAKRASLSHNAVSCREPQV